MELIVKYYSFTTIQDWTAAVVGSCSYMLYDRAYNTSFTGI